MHKVIRNLVTNTIEKVTVFVTRPSIDGPHLLLIRHPYAGIQIPAGTVEPSESPEEAARREVFEETGLTISSTPTNLGYQEIQLPADEAIILPPATVYARPDRTSFDWIKIRSGVQVKVLRRATGFTQIMYIEQDQEPNPSYVSLQIIGWAPDESLARVCRRHFFHLNFEGDTEPQWTINTDCHTFTLFWAPRKDLPAIIPPQDTWLTYLEKFLP
jgi:8-oxo-dGTP pyrophosphatase MutT (NUDIX family)